jgi:tetratricopeptide (TPR) repeat protein
LSDDEALELRKFFEGYGITAEKENEETPKIMFEKLFEFIKGQHKVKYWMYYMLGDMLTMRGQFKEAISTYTQATDLSPADPRAWYSMAVLHRAISYEPDRRKTWQKDLANALKKDKKMAENMQQWEKQNQNFLQAASESQLAKSPVETANTAFTYFQKVLECNISEQDRARVQDNVRSLEEWKKTK